MLDDERGTTTDRSIKNSFTSTRSGKKICILSCCTGLYLQAHYLRSKLLNKAYEIRLAYDDFSEYLEWTLNFEENDLVRIG